MGRLKDRVIFITGAAGGMGRMHARRFIDEGAKVVLADISEDVHKQAEELGENALPIILDVTDFDSWEKAIKETEEKFGPVQGLINNAGIVGPIEPIQDYPIDEYKKIIEINQLGTFLGLKAVYPSMKRAGEGSIVNISSAAGISGNPGQIAYDSSKFAVRGMTTTAAKEFAKDNIRVNSVHPGPIDTGMLTQEELDGFSDVTLLNRAGEPEEITNMVLYLVSEESTYSTGSVFVVDGGMTV